jgi:hypothetical protein
VREHFHVTCQGGHASAMVMSYDAKANAALAAQLAKAISTDTKRADVISVTVPGGYATALVYDHTPAEASTLAALLNAAILRASENWRPSHPPV